MINYFFAIRRKDSSTYDGISNSLFVRYYIRSKLVVCKIGIGIDRISLRLASGYICIYMQDLVFRKTRMAPLKYRLRKQISNNFIPDLVYNVGAGELYCDFRYYLSLIRM